MQEQSPADAWVLPGLKRPANVDDPQSQTTASIGEGAAASLSPSSTTGRFDGQPSFAAADTMD
ncbi:hypothetical protein NL358_28050, partial [Klebsiella pneumoniae]|nr:hypothetical protein [Klebsiella pneumoniae]